MNLDNLQDKPEIDQDKLYNDVMTVGFAVRIAETCGPEYIKQVGNGRDPITTAELAGKVGEFSFMVAQKIMENYPKIPKAKKMPEIVEFPTMPPQRMQ